MKKLLCLMAIAVLSVCSVNAQDTPVKYQGEVDLGYSVGVGTWDFSRLNVHTVQGVKIGKYFSTGVGVGIDYYFSNDILDAAGIGGQVMIPIYLNMKGYLPVSESISPYISLDLGGGIGVQDLASGFLVTPSVGVKIGKFKVQVGYTSQSFNDGVSSGAVQFKVGMMF